MNITFTDDNGKQTPIEVEPTHLHAVITDDGAVKVTITYDREDLAVGNPDGYKALQSSWPGHGALTVDTDQQHTPPDPAPGEPQPLPTEANLFKGSMAEVSFAAEAVRVTALADSTGGEPGDDQPVINATPNSADASGLTIDFTVDNKGQGAGSLDFGDSTETQPNAGDGTTATSHAYSVAGSYTATFTDDDQPARTASYALTIPPTA